MENDVGDTTSNSTTVGQNLPNGSQHPREGLDTKPSNGDGLQPFSLPNNTSQSPSSTTHAINQTPSEGPSAQSKEQDSDSDLEIIEVRNVQSTNHADSVWGKHSSVSLASDDNTDEDTDRSALSDISSLDDELNNALTSTTTLPSQRDYSSQQVHRATGQPTLRSPPKSTPIHTLLPEFFKPHIASKGPPPPGYRNIPPNLVYAINRELNIWMETATDDDIEMVEKLVFSLKDPIVRTKIKLPIKSTTCRHFECFDFQTFCEFYGLKDGTKHFLKTTLLQQSRAAREAENLFLKQQQRIAAGTLRLNSREIIYPFFSEHGQMFFTELYNRTPPLYKCPLCDEKFGLKQLYISDIFNFFVKTTPRNVTKVQLEGARFKIIEDDAVEKKEEEQEVVDLSDEDNEGESEENGQENKEEQEVKNNASEPEKAKSAESSIKADRSMTADDFNDGLDDVLLTINKGDGSWNHPVTLD